MAALYSLIFLSLILLSVFGISNGNVGGFSINGKVRFPGFNTGGFGLPAKNSNLKIILNGGERVTFLRPDGYFSFHNVPAGTHLIEVSATGYFFSPVRVDVSARNPGKVQAALTENRRVLTELILEPLREEQYYEVREPFNIMSLVKSPMGLMIGFMVVVVFVMPKLVGFNTGGFGLPAKNSNLKIILNGGERVTFLRPDGYFSFHNVPAGTHLIEVSATGYFFSPVRVDVSARNPGKVQAALTENRRVLTELILEPLREEQYYEVREPFNIMSLVKSPMGLMIGFMVVVVFVMPKLVDPEELKRAQEEMGSQGIPSLANLLGGAAQRAN